MKTQYEAVFAKHVTAKVQKSAAVGLLAQWSTAAHLDALAEAMAGAEDMRDCLGECYNVSAFQQGLAKKFAGTGHFQRAAVQGAGKRLDDTLALLAASLPKVG